jgi:sec-independent protein translocase protein TatC
VALVPFPSQNRNDENLPEKGFSPFDDEEQPGEGRMTFLEHLDELRKRITHAVGGLLVGFIVAFAFIGRVQDFIYQRLTKDIPGGHLIFTEPGEGFMLMIKMAGLTGVLIASPYIMLQVWLFIAPGLYANEKKFAVPFVLMSSIGFVGGAAFNHYIIFPFMMTFFASLNTADLIFMPRLEDVFDLYSKMLIGMGLVFQMPTVVFFLAKMRMVTARFLLRNTKYAVLAIFVIAAVITPSGDMVTQTIFAAPMLGLYALSILIAWIVTPKSEIS